MLLHKPKGADNVGGVDGTRFKFAWGDWLELLPDRQTPNRSPAKEHSQEEEHRRGQAACNRVKHGQVSRARQELIGAALAPKTLDTSAELQGRRPQERVREIPPGVFVSHPRPVDLDSFLFAKCLVWPVHHPEVPQDLGECTYEMLKVCLEDADRPSSVPCTGTHHQSTHGSHDDGALEARWWSAWISTGTSFHRLVAKTWARQFDAQRTILSIHGVGSCARLAEHPSCTMSPVSRSLLPFNKNLPTPNPHVCMGKWSKGQTPDPVNKGTRLKPLLAMLTAPPLIQCPTIATLHEGPSNQGCVFWEIQRSFLGIQKTKGLFFLWDTKVFFSGIQKAF